MEKYAYKKLETKNIFNEETLIHFDRSLNKNLSVSWHNINVLLPNPTKSCWSKCCSSASETNVSKQILKNVNGIAHSNQLLAIMGASGVGKTTLLNVLTRRTASNLLVDGEMKICGNSVSQEAFLRMSAYVQQQNLFAATLTVREQLIFQALLRMNKEIPYDQRLKRVEEIIIEIGLTKCADTLIGNPTTANSISAGELKRLAFAAEVLTNPPLMFCDEPTSGLDSFMAKNVITVLKEMATKGKVVISTIHQPSSDVFAMFDRILLMAEGRVAFYGSRDAAYEYFKSQKFECPSSFNPADFYIMTLAIAPGMAEESKRKVEAICDHFDGSDEKVALLHSMDKTIHVNTCYNEEGSLLNKNETRYMYKTSWLTQFRALMWRSVLIILREPQSLKTKLFKATFVAILISTMFFHQTLNQEGVSNINSVIFLLLIDMTYQNIYVVIEAFCKERPLFYREHENGMYGIGAYFWAKTLAEAPLYVLIAAIFTTITYWTTGLYPDFIQFVLACAIVCLVTLCVCSYGYMISTICGNISLALTLAGPFVSLLLYFGGFFMNTKSFPRWLEWMEHLSWFRFGNEALIINQWKNVHYIECNRPWNQTCLRNGVQVIESLNFNPNNFRYDIILLMSQLLAYHFIAYLVFVIRTKNRR